MRIGQESNKKYLYVTVREIIGAVKSVTAQLKSLKKRKDISNLGDTFVKRLKGSYGDITQKAMANAESSLKRVINPVLKLITLDETYQKTMKAYQTLKPVVETIARASGAWTAPGNIAEIAEIATGIATQYLVDIAMSAYVSLKSKVLAYEIKILIGSVEVINDIENAMDIISQKAIEESNPTGDNDIFTELLEKDENKNTGGKPDNFIIDTIGLAFTLEIEDKGTIAGSEENGLYYVENSEFVKYTDGKFKRETGLDDNSNNATRPADYNDDIICIGKKNGGVLYTENWKDKSLENFDWTLAKLNEEPLQFYGTELNELNYDIKTLNKEAYVGDKYINTISYDMWKCVESGEVSSWQWERRIENDINDSNLLRTISIDTLDGTISSTDECTTDIEPRRVVQVNGSIGNKVSVDRNKVYRFSCLFNGTLTFGNNYVSDGWSLLVYYYSCNDLTDGIFNDNGFYKIDKQNGIVKISDVENKLFSGEFIDFSNVTLNGSLYEIRFDELTTSDYPTLEEIYSGLTTNRFRGIKTSDKAYYNYDIVLDNGCKYLYSNNKWLLHDTVKTYDSPYGSNILSKNWNNLGEGISVNLPNKRIKYYYNINNISQTVNLIKGKKYIFSCYAKGTVLNFNYNDRTEEIILSDKWNKYSKAFIAKFDTYDINISGDNLSIAGTKLEEVEEIKEEEILPVNDENVIELQSLKKPKGKVIGQYGKLENKYYNWNGLEWEQCAELPTDPVLHYSFDELPDLPDGTSQLAVMENTYDVLKNWLKNVEPEITNVNGNIEITSPTLNAGIFKYYTVKTTEIVKIKVKVKTGVINKIGIEGGNVKYGVGSGEYIFSGDGKNRAIILYGYIGCVFEVEELYIGDASYTTPVIDNSGNNHNATNVKGLSVKGISGKSIYTTGEIITGFTDLNFPLSKPWSYSFWCDLKSSELLAKAKSYSDYTSQFIGMGTMLFGVNNTYDSYGVEIRCDVFNPEEVLIRVNVFERNLSASQYIGFVDIANNVLDKGFVNLTVTRDGSNTKIYINGEYLNSFVSETKDININKILGINVGGFMGGNHHARPNVFTIDDFQIFNRPLTDQEVLGLYLSKGNTPKRFTKKDYLIDLYDNDNLVTAEEKKDLLKNWLDIYNKENPETLSLDIDGEFSTLIKEAQEVGFSLSNDYVENFIKSVEEIRILFWDKEKGILINLNEDYNDLQTPLSDYFNNYKSSYNILKEVIKKQSIGLVDDVLVVQDNQFSAITKTSKITNNITVYENKEEADFTITVNDYNGFSYTEEPITISNNTITFDASKVEFSNTEVEINYKITVGEYERYITQTLYLYDEIYSLKTDNLVLKREENVLSPVTASVYVCKENEKLESGEFTLEAYENNNLIGYSNGVSLTVSTVNNYPILFKLLKDGMLLDQLIVNIMNNSDGKSTAWVNKETEKVKEISDANMNVDYISYLNDNTNKKGAFVALSNTSTDEHEVLDVYYSNDGKYWAKSNVDLDVNNYTYNKVVKKS